MLGCTGNRRASLERQYQEAQLQFLQGYADQPLESAERGFAHSGDFPELNWKFRILRADAQTRKGNASAALEGTEPQPPAGIPPAILWQRMLVRGFAFCNLGKFAEADEQFSAAESAQNSDTHSVEALILIKARCAFLRRDFSSASSLFQTVKTTPAIEPFTNLYAVHGLGISAMRQRRFEEAVHWFQMEKDAASQLDALPLQEVSLGNLGYVYSELGEFQKGLDNSSQASELAGKLGLVEHQEKWFLEIGRAYHNLSRFGLAEQNYNKALAIARERGDDPMIALCLHNLIQIDLSNNDLARAERRHAEDGKLKLEGDSLRDFKADEATIAAAKHDWQTAERLFLGLVGEFEGDYRRTWSLQGELARVYSGKGNVKQADAWFQRSIATMESAAEGMHEREVKRAMLGNLPIFDDYIEFLVAHHQPERALQVAQIARARTLEEDLGFKPRKEDAKGWITHIQSMLRRQNSVLLAYYEAEHATYAWAVTKGGFRVNRLQVSQNELETLADTYRNEIDQHTSLEDSGAQQKLYQLLVKPVQDLVPKDGHVILVSDSALYRINFECLISDQGRPHYWIEDAEIENASSIDLLLYGKRRSRSSKGVLLIGDPEQEDPQYPRLPHAADEMASVEGQFTADQIQKLTGRAATPDAYASIHPEQFRFMEFAAHGTANSSNPLDSAVILSKGKNTDFKLFARDIEKQKLNAELVTISACYGGGTARTSSEGLLGLQSAFLRAGAHQVIAGLWDVDDQSAPLLMGGTYQGVVHGRSAASALRAAKLKILSSSSANKAPYYWGALQLYVGS